MDQSISIPLSDLVFVIVVVVAFVIILAILQIQADQQVKRLLAHLDRMSQEKRDTFDARVEGVSRIRRAINWIELGVDDAAVIQYLDETAEVLIMPEDYQINRPYVDDALGSTRWSGTEEHSYQ